MFTANFGSADCHILIGTPKEIAAFVSVRVFNIEDVSMFIADDADVVVTTKLIQDQVMNRLKRCRKILLSAACLKSVADADYKRITIKEPMNTDQYFMKMNDITEKFAVVVKVYNLLKTFNGRCIVFCNVSIFVYFRIKICFVFLIS